MTTFLGIVLVVAIIITVVWSDVEFRRIRRVRYAVLQLLEGGVYTIPELFQSIEGAQECHECATCVHRAVRALVDAGLIDADRETPDRLHFFRITDAGIEHLALLRETRDVQSPAVLRRHDYLHDD